MTATTPEPNFDVSTPGRQNESCHSRVSEGRDRALHEERRERRRPAAECPRCVCFPANIAAGAIPYVRMQHGCLVIYVRLSDGDLHQAFPCNECGNATAKWEWGRPRTQAPKGNRERRPA
jgi:hypothetical protein